MVDLWLWRGVRGADPPDLIWIRGKLRRSAGLIQSAAQVIVYVGRGSTA
jgi:hypothetical protein